MQSNWKICSMSNAYENLLIILVGMLAALKIRKKPNFIIMRFSDARDWYLAESAGNIDNVDWLTKARYLAAQTVDEVEPFLQCQTKPGRSSSPVRVVEIVWFNL